MSCCPPVVRCVAQSICIPGGIQHGQAEFPRALVEGRSEINILKGFILVKQWLALVFHLKRKCSKITLREFFRFLGKKGNLFEL